MSFKVSLSNTIQLILSEDRAEDVIIKGPEQSRLRASPRLRSSRRSFRSTLTLLQTMQWDICDIGVFIWRRIFFSYCLWASIFFNTLMALSFHRSIQNIETYRDNCHSSIIIQQPLWFHQPGHHPIDSKIFQIPVHLSNSQIPDRNSSGIDHAHYCSYQVFDRVHFGDNKSIKLAGAAKCSIKISGLCNGVGTNQGLKLSIRGPIWVFGGRTSPTISSLSGWANFANFSRDDMRRCELLVHCR